MLLYLLFTLSFCLSTCHPLDESSAIFFPDDDRINDESEFGNNKPDSEFEGEFGSEEAPDFGKLQNRNQNKQATLTPSDCLAVRNALPFEDPETGEQACFDIASQGPCEEGDWFVLSTSDPPEGDCFPRPCPEDEILFNGECELEDATSVCPDGMELLINPFGDGECDCLPDFLYFNKNGSEACYPELTRGPCPMGEQIVRVEPEIIRSEDGESDSEFEPEIKCQEHGCRLGETQWFNGKCMVEPSCSPNEYIEEQSGRLVCAFGKRQLIIIPEKCPEGQTQNYDGECKEVVHFGSRGQSRPTRRIASRTVNLANFGRRFGRK